MDQRCLGIHSQVDTLTHDDLLAILMGCSPDSLPPLGSYYDFINRLWLMAPALEKFDHKDTFPCVKNKKPSIKLAETKNFPTYTSGDKKKWRNGSALAGISLFTMKTPSKSFHIATIIPSLTFGLLPSENLTISGDGTPLCATKFPHGFLGLQSFTS